MLLFEHSCTLLYSTLPNFLLASSQAAWLSRLASSCSQIRPATMRGWGYNFYTPPWQHTAMRAKADVHIIKRCTCCCLHLAC